MGTIYRQSSDFTTSQKEDHLLADKLEK